MAEYAEEQKKRGRKADPHTMQRILLAFHPYPFRIILILLAILATTLLSLVNPFVIRLIFDVAFAKRDSTLLFYCVGVLIITPAISGVIGVGQTYFSNAVGQQVMYDFRDKLYAHLHRMSFRFFTSTRIGEIQSRLSNDISSAQNIVIDASTTIVTNVVMVLSTVIAMIFISPLLTLITLGLLPFILWTTHKVGKARRRNQMSIQQSIATLTAFLQETLSVSGILLIKTFGRQKFAQQQFQIENQRLTNLTIHRQMIGRWFFMLVSVIMAATPAIVYLVAGLQIIHGSRGIAGITLGGIVAFTTLQTRLYGPLTQLLGMQVEVQGALALFDRIFQYLDLPVEIQNKPDALDLSDEQVRGEIKFQNVSFTYKQEKSEALEQLFASKKEQPHPPVEAQIVNAAPRQTLHNLSFHIQPGQLAALVGPSGAGKTSITYLVPRIFDTDEGTVTIDGHDVKDLTLESLSNLVGMVTQETYLFHASIRDNLLYARPDAPEEEIIAAAKTAAIHERILELEEGYDTLVGERGYKLSGGEKQRLAIARVLLKDPRILILDEATSSLDSSSERLIQAALEPLMKSRTTLAIAHRLSTILAADLILVVDKGEIVESGTHQTLLQQGGLYKKLYQEQFANELDKKAI
ncbi:ABC transporter ATP-binding protein [Dictyobacter formicarum]|nr:ABC transporter ATP-binding protein [Dictyobacter formicarum]